jgi:hypothetical protein
MRCTLRIAQRGTFVDGEPLSRTDAVSVCKRTAGAVVVIEDDVPCSEWEPVCTALHREGVAIALRGPVGDFRMPRLPANANPPPATPVRCAATCK